MPYHNAAHGACVAHGAYWFACNPAIRGAASSPIEMFSLILAALMHDVGHTGSPRPNPRPHPQVSCRLALGCGAQCGYYPRTQA